MLESGQLTMGPKVAELEDELARACGVEHAVAVSSGTAALHLARARARARSRATRCSCPPTPSRRRRTSSRSPALRPVLVDVDPTTMNLDPSAATAVGAAHAARCSPSTSSAAARLERAARRAAGRALVEDAAGALGARRRAALRLARQLGCLTFHPRKIVTTGEGGAITTSDGEIADAVRRLRHHGTGAARRPDMPEPGLNYRLSDVLCAVGLPQLRRLRGAAGSADARRGRYEERLAGLVGRRRAARATSTAGRRTSSGSSAATRCSPRCARQGIEAQIGTFASTGLRRTAARARSPAPTAAFEQALALPVPHAA